MAHPPCPECSNKGLIFVVDGAGGFLATSEGLRGSIERLRAPLCAQTYYWSHGYGRVLADHMDHCHIRSESRKLAFEIMRAKRRSPTRPIFLVGHSAGAAPALYAAALLPPDTLECTVILAPSVSADFDLRGGLRASKNGVDVFYSEKDRTFLGVATRLFGTTDGNGTTAAGRVGFRPIACASREDQLLYQARLRQHPWQSVFKWTGNEGGHYGPYQPKFLDTYVTPIFIRALNGGNAVRR